MTSPFGVSTGSPRMVLTSTISFMLSMAVFINPSIGWSAMSFAPYHAVDKTFHAGKDNMSHLDGKYTIQHGLPTRRFEPGQDDNTRSLRGKPVITQKKP